MPTATEIREPQIENRVEFREEVRVPQKPGLGKILAHRTSGRYLRIAFWTQATRSVSDANSQR